MATAASEQAAPRVKRIWDYQRRIRELRDEKGMQIRSRVERHDLEPGTKWARLRAEVLDRNGFTCQMCGLSPGDIDPATGRKVRLHLGHIKDKSLGGKDELSNLRALCSTCNQARRTSQVKSRPEFGSYPRSAAPGRMSSGPFLNGFGRNSAHDGQNLERAAQRQHARCPQPKHAAGNTRAADRTRLRLPFSPS